MEGGGRGGGGIAYISKELYDGFTYLTTSQDNKHHRDPKVPSALMTKSRQFQREQRNPESPNTPSANWSRAMKLGCGWLRTAFLLPRKERDALMGSHLTEV